METKNSYVNFQKALYDEKYGHPQEAENWWKVCAHDCPGQLLTQAVGIAVRNRFLLNPLIERITIEEWDRCVQTLVEHIPQTDMDSFFKDIFPLLKDYPLCASKIRQYFLEKQLSRNALEHTELVKLLGRYCEGFTTAAKKIYRDEVLSGSEAYILPSQYRFAFLIDKVLSLIEDGQFTGCIPLLKEAFHISPGMTIVVGQLTRHLTEQIEKPPKVVSEEFAALGKQVKGVLSGLMEKGQWEEAYGVTAQLIPLLPDDLEVLRMKQIILREGMYGGMPVLRQQWEGYYSLFLFPPGYEIEKQAIVSPAKLWMKCDACGNYFTYNFPKDSVGSINGHYTDGSAYDPLQNKFKLHNYNPIFNRFKRLASGTEYLEIVVGTGEMLAVALEFGYHVEAVEICREDCERISQALGVEIKWCDIIDYETEKQYGVIVMGDVLEHVTNPVKVLEKVKRMLAEDGVLWITTPNYNCAYARMEKFSHSMWHELNHYT